MKDHYLLKTDLYRIISKGFSYPEAALLADMKALIAEVLTSPELSTECHAFLEHILAACISQEVHEEYSRLFFKGSVPLNESAYVAHFQVLADVASFYQAFGMSPKSGDAPDALPYELEFTAILTLKVALAQNAAHQEVSLAAYQKFLQEHLANFVSHFREKLLSTDPHPFYLALINLLRYLIQLESYP